MKWILLGVVATSLVVGMGMILSALSPDPNILSGWDTEERRRMMLRAEEDQDNDLRFI